MPSLRGILLARTHFEVLGFDTDASGVRDISDADVRAAYRRTALRCHPDKCTDLGAQTAFVRVGQAFATLKTAATREAAWRDVVSGRGRLPSTLVPGAAAASTTTPLEQSASGLRAEGEALVAELRRWKEEWASNLGSAVGEDRAASTGEGSRPTRRFDPAGVGSTLSVEALAPMFAGAIVTVRERGRVDVKPKQCSLWLGRGKPHVLNYRWTSSPSHRPDGAWSLDRDVVRVGRMRPANGGEGSCWSVALSSGVSLVMTAASPAAADAWVKNLKAIKNLAGGRKSKPGEGSPGEGGSPARSAFGAPRALSFC